VTGVKYVTGGFTTIVLLQQNVPRLISASWIATASGCVVCAASKLVKDHLYHALYACRILYSGIVIQQAWLCAQNAVAYVTCFVCQRQHKYNTTYICKEVATGCVINAYRVFNIPPPTFGGRRQYVFRLSIHLPVLFL